jgi:hypothetical protein
LLSLPVRLRPEVDPDLDEDPLLLVPPPSPEDVRLRPLTEFLLEADFEDSRPVPVLPVRLEVPPSSS